jgi:hypothetical protein
MIRLSTAHAKCRLSSEVTQLDAQAALDMMNFALFNEAAPRTAATLGATPTSAPAPAPEAAAVRSPLPHASEHDDDWETPAHDDVTAGTHARSDESAEDQPPRKRARDQEDGEHTAVHMDQTKDSAQVVGGEEGSQHSQVSQVSQDSRLTLLEDTARVELFERLALDALKVTEQCRLDEVGCGW